MSTPKTGKSKSGEKMHYSVGALIQKDNKILLIDRKSPPYGFAGIAGHIDEGETPTEALIREVREESGLEVVSYKLIFAEEVEENRCKRGINTHYWYLYKCETKGKIVQNIHETKSIGWYDEKDLPKLNLEPVWAYWFKKLSLIK